MWGCLCLASPWIRIGCTDDLVPDVYKAHYGNKGSMLTDQVKGRYSSARSVGGTLLLMSSAKELWRVQMFFVEGICKGIRSEREIVHCWKGNDRSQRGPEYTRGVNYS